MKLGWKPRLVRTRRPVEEHIELPRHATGKARDPMTLALSTWWNSAGDRNQRTADCRDSAEERCAGENYEAKWKMERKRERI